ncbi:hypothetical protein [Mycolicibacterium frederiksbergense]|uniref:Uncharacterized protein n=1 Tax=Mycolicibacterium frederiksbergense TaxID=117567 RepID=A0A6H0RXF5_9MYCO|nr:hypothetical protein [Mycolicibacterium frederiksbergense]QIV79624.1 hypothetical protein EXE63_00850 [Mycolicibacterium frederiksbergense]
MAITKTVDLILAALLVSGAAVACSDDKPGAEGWPGILVSEAPVYDAPFDSTSDILANTTTAPSQKWTLPANSTVTAICQSTATTYVKDLSGTTPTETAFVKINLDGGSGFVRRSVVRAQGRDDTNRTQSIDQIRSC